MTHGSFSQNEVQPGLVEVRWVMVLLCTTWVHPFGKGENCVFSCTSQMYQFYIV